MVAAVVLGTASLAAATSIAIDGPAHVTIRARRLNPTFEPDLTPEQRAVVETVNLVNHERGTRGLPPLRLDDRAAAAARSHAVDMAASATMRHVGSDGADGGDRLAAAGYEWSSWAENLGAGFVDPRTLVAVWMDSSGHRSNLLGDFADIGVGVEASAEGILYWSLLVARSSGDR